ncbi:nuclear transport factor 2 family protein [Pedobacter sp.]|uniref:nuclear transport factor 2 family protein n=1 Tax=Pedobacter sp. TaxID=1411316 RepID=UPI0031D1CA9F
MMFKNSLFFFFLFLLIGTITKAQHPFQPKDPSLQQTIFKQDSLLFDALNRQDIKALGAFFSQDLEFYNDGGGKTDLKTTMENFGSLFARNKASNLHRELEKASLEVYPIPGYGAIALGNHRFLHTENGKQEIGKQKFIITWKFDNNQWLATRIVSLGH